MAEGEGAAEGVMFPDGLAPPVWLADDLAVPLELETTYEETCRVLRIP